MNYMLIVIYSQGKVDSAWPNNTYTWSVIAERMFSHRNKIYTCSVRLRVKHIIRIIQTQSKGNTIRYTLVHAFPVLYALHSTVRFNTMNSTVNTITSPPFRYVFTIDDPFTCFEMRTKSPTERGLDRFIIILRRMTSGGDGGVLLKFSHQDTRTTSYQDMYLEVTLANPGFVKESLGYEVSVVNFYCIV